MVELTYSGRLAFTLFAGMEQLPPADRNRWAAHLRACRNPDGGWPGREGPSDLYYTGFALRSLAMLGALTADEAARAADFLRSCLPNRTSITDFFSWLYSASLLPLAGGPNLLAEASAGWEDRTAEQLAEFRTSDGGYGQSPAATSGSLYLSFLVALCHTLISRPLPQEAQLLEFVRSRRRDDGGYAEAAAMRRGGTNPTAAAVALGRILRPDGEDVNRDVASGVVDFLCQRVSREGGFRANSRIAAADLLSTFTALWTLKDLDALVRIDAAAMRQFVAALEQPQGGFRAGLWDDRSDPEYTFYGLGSLALLAAPATHLGEGT
jgi:geranylgeranyl transferase type-2 subunit beta